MVAVPTLKPLTVAVVVRVLPLMLYSCVGASATSGSELPQETLTFWVSPFTEVPVTVPTVPVAVRAAVPPTLMESGVAVTSLMPVTLLVQVPPVSTVIAPLLFTVP